MSQSFPAQSAPVPTRFPEAGDAPPQAPTLRGLHPDGRWFDTTAADTGAADDIDASNADRIDWLRAAPFVAIHVGCLAVFWVGVSAVAVWVAVALYALRKFAVTGFYHSYFSHRTFPASRALQFVFALIGASSVQRGAAVVGRASPRPPPPCRDRARSTFAGRAWLRLERHVFPGSFVPSINVLLAAKTRSSNLALTRLEDFGGSYALTPQAWRQRFLARLPQVRAQGFDERFIRMWEFYLAYCEGGFRERSIDVAQLLMAKPGHRGAPFLPGPPAGRGVAPLPTPATGVPSK